MDETYRLLENTPRRGWYRERRPVLPVRGRRRAGGRLTVIGAIGANGAHHFGFYDAGNWENVEDFVAEIHEKFGRALVFMDNASFHKKAALRKMTRDTGGDMQFGFFPPHTPELNPIETQWAQFKRSLSGMEFESAEEIADTPQRGIDSKVLPVVKMHDYLVA